MRLKSIYNYYKNRVDAHGIHSPFVFDFYNSVVLKASTIEDKSIRSKLLQLKSNQTIIEVEDLGAGSKKIGKASKRSIAQIAKTASIKPKYGRLLAKLIDRYNLTYGIELGTSLGIGSLYLCHSSKLKKLITIEGAPEIAKIASTNFKEFNEKRIKLMQGSFDEHLQLAVDLLPRIDFVFIDGNHTYEATMKYFNFFADRINENTFLIFDDIYWSDEMKKAWSEIIASKKMNVSLDFLQIGIVCKRAGQAKQNFILKY